MDSNTLNDQQYKMKQHKIEVMVYWGLWLLVVTLVMLDGFRENIDRSLPTFNSEVLLSGCKALIPFLFLFVVNNYILIPRFLRTNRYGLYWICVVGLLVATLGMQYHLFLERMHVMPAPPRYPRPHHHLLPKPLMFDVTYDLLIIGVNCAISLMFQNYKHLLEHEKLKKVNAESQLSYLKAQINPHFYMNMLNNIHGMIEIDADKAQEMVIDMSRLMRYMLYESSANMIPLNQEVAFLRDYIGLMRSRFPEDKVEISEHYPLAHDMEGIDIPPLLFLVFVENAFKHGVSFKDSSFVIVDVSVSDNSLIFKCMNSMHKSKTTLSEEGIGLKNVSQRLKLIYGQKAVISTSTGDNFYCTTLILPII